MIKLNKIYPIVLVLRMGLYAIGFLILPFFSYIIGVKASQDNFRLPVRFLERSLEKCKLEIDKKNRELIVLKHIHEVKE